MWHGYFLIKKPAALSQSDFLAVCESLKKTLGKSDESPQPCRRMQYRANLAGDAVILESVFDDPDLDARDLTRLCKYISNALAGKFTASQVKTALKNNTTIFGELGATWETSRAACADYLAANRATWETTP